MRRVRLVATILVSVSLATPARAADALELRPSYDLTADIAVTAATAGTTLVLLATKQQLAPPSCRWCNPPGFDLDVVRSLAWSDPGAAGTASDVLVVALGAGALGVTVLDGYRRGDSETGFVNALLVAEATSVAMLLDTGVKYAVGRSRPYVVLGHSTAAPTRDDNLSFFSGHTTFAFAVAASTSTLLLSQHAPGAEVTTAVAFAAAGTVGYLRIAAEAHYLTDVLAGAAVGTVVGWAVPHFFHAPSESGVKLQPALGGVAIAW
jgi:membrane-associated phospholipid phosphatase